MKTQLTIQYKVYEDQSLIRYTFTNGSYINHRFSVLLVKYDSIVLVASILLWIKKYF